MGEQGCGFFRDCGICPHERLASPPGRRTCFRQLSTSRAGLDDAEAQRVLERVGPNRLEPTRPISAIRVLRDQFKSVVVYLLIAATGISFALGDRVESIAIAAVLAINTIIGFVTELRARRAMEALLQFDVSKATVDPLGAASNYRCRDDCAGRHRSARHRPAWCRLMRV